MSEYIPVNEPLLEGNEKKYLNECIETGWISSEGPFVTKFEDEMSKYVNRKYGISVSNGTVALDLAVAALDLQPGDEVIMPAFTIISCANAIIRNNCVPVLIDSDPVTWNMDVTQIEGKITPKTRAIMVVHIYGLPVNMDPIIEIAKKYDLFIIEDAAEMHGQTYNGKKCGSFGDISIFSFYPNKHITTGEGGMVLTDNELLANRCKSLRNLAFKPERRFVHDEIGFNYRMTNIQAAIGLAQLERIEEFIQIKRNMGALYTNLLNGARGLQLPLQKMEYADNIYWVYGLVLEDRIPCMAQEVMKRLAENGVGTRPFFWPMHLQPVFQKMGYFKEESYPVAERLAERGFYVPSGLKLTTNQIEEVVHRLNSVMEGIN